MHVYVCVRRDARGHAHFALTTRAPFTHDRFSHLSLRYLAHSPAERNLRHIDRSQWQCGTPSRRWLRPMGCIHTSYM